MNQESNITKNIILTKEITFHILMLNHQYWPLSMREHLIRAVKTYAKMLNIPESSIKSETVTRTYRKLVEVGILPKDSSSVEMEQLHKAVWGESF